MTAEIAWYDAAPAVYPPDLYPTGVDTRAIETLAEVRGEAVERFRQDGYLAVRQAFSAEEAATVLEALLDLLGGARPDYQGVQWEKAAEEILDTLPGERRQDAVRKFWKFVDYDPRLLEFSRHPGLLEAVTRLIDAPPELLQDMALFKPPLLGREKPWHQDCAYFNLPQGTPVLGAWIALDEATVENGCMCVLPGSHRAGPMIHFQRRDWQICDTAVARGGAVAVPLPPGGCLFFHGLLQHGTPANRSRGRRRAIQLHYKPVGVEATPPEERLAVFGSEGKEVSC